MKFRRRLLLKTMLAALVATGFFCKAQGSLRNELIMYWSMDSLDGEYVPDQVGTNHLQAHNITITNLVEGKFGKALSLDGTSQFLSLTSDRSSDLPVYKRQEFTIAMWVRGAPNQVNRILVAEGSRKSIYPLFLLGTHRDGRNGQMNLFIRSTGVMLNNIPTEGTVFNNEWTHVAWVNLGSSAKVYINGKENTEYRYERPSLPLDYFSVGALYRDPPVYFFRGEIDELAVWQRLLKPEEIKALMLHGIDGENRSTLTGTEAGGR